MRRLMKMTVIVAALAAGGLPMSLARAEDPPADATLAQLAAGELKIVNLAWPLNSTSPYWPGDRYEPFTLKTIATIERDGVLSKSFCSPEHLGTHLDAPNHFAAGQKSVDQLDPHDLFAPGVVLDIVPAAAANADYRLTAADVAVWEQRHGRIPNGALVLLRTGWGRFWNQPVRYAGKDVHGMLHFPGYSLGDRRDAGQGPQRPRHRHRYAEHRLWPLSRFRRAPRREWQRPVWTRKPGTSRAIARDRLLPVCRSHQNRNWQRRSLPCVCHCSIAAC